MQRSHSKAASFDSAKTAIRHRLVMAALATLVIATTYAYAVLAAV